MGKENKKTDMDFMMASGWMELNVGRGNSNTKQAQSIKANGKITYLKAKEFLLMQEEMFIKETLKQGISVELER